MYFSLQKAEINQRIKAYEKTGRFHEDVENDGEAKELLPEKVDYLSKNSLLGLNPQLLIETSFIVKSFPEEIKDASSMIYDYLKINGNDETIKKYGLEPFSIRVQTLERTFIDKVFALCDYMLDKKVSKQYN